MDKKTLPSNNDEKPLVTFALFTYNQESFVQEAIDAAFAQTYEPLEIIFSDDCSSDKTFEILQEAAQRYRGPHSFSVRQTPNNLGTLLHVANVAQASKGDLFVLAAGDDVSKPNRVECLVREWLATEAWGFSSKYDVIDENGGVISLNQGEDTGYGLRGFLYESEGDIQIAHGGTSAYDKRIFEYLTLSDSDYVLSEDGLISLLLNLIGKKIVYVDESLVLYRSHGASITNSQSLPLSFADVIKAEASVKLLAISQRNRCRVLLRLNNDIGTSKVRRLNVDNVNSALKMQTLLAEFDEYTFTQRIKLFLLNANFFTLRWILPRLLGMNLFYVQKITLNLIRHCSRLILAGVKSCFR